MICGSCSKGEHGECPGSAFCFCQNPEHPTILTNQQRNDFAVYGTTEPWRLAIDAITDPDISN